MQQHLTILNFKSFLILEGLSILINFCSAIIQEPFDMIYLHGLPV